MVKKVALISDIHANASAYTAVESDIRQQNVDAVWSLGDITGRGPDPILTTRNAMRLYNAQSPEDQACWLAGNHDYLVLGKLSRNIFMDDVAQGNNFLGTESGLNGSAVTVAELHASRLSRIAPVWNWLNNLTAHAHPHKNVYLAHGLYMLELGTVVDRFAHSMYGRPSTFKQMFQSLYEQAPADEQPHLVLLGHTHEAGIWRWHQKTKTIETLELPQRPIQFTDLTQMPLVINPGSVGFSRNIPAATYALLEFDEDYRAVTVQFRAISYTCDLENVELTITEGYPQQYLTEIERLIRN